MRITLFFQEIKNIFDIFHFVCREIKKYFHKCTFANTCIYVLWLGILHKYYLSFNRLFYILYTLVTVFVHHVLFVTHITIYCYIWQYWKDRIIHI